MHRTRVPCRRQQQFCCSTYKGEGYTAVYIGTPSQVDLHHTALVVFASCITQNQLPRRPWRPSAHSAHETRDHEVTSAPTFQAELHENHAPRRSGGDVPNSPTSLGRAKHMALLTPAAAAGEGPPTKDMVRLAAITVPAANALFNIFWWSSTRTRIHTGSRRA